MSKLSPEELEDFIRNEIDPESNARRLIYDELRKKGLSHKDALIKTIDDINSIKSESIPKDQLEIIKNALLKGPGKFV